MQDVGHAILESYSRILESLAHTVLSRIEDVLYADSLAQNPSLANCKRNPLTDIKITSMKFPNAEEEIEKLNARGTPTTMTLLDFIGWTVDHGDTEGEKPKGVKEESNEEPPQKENNGDDDTLRLGIGKIQIPYLVLPKKLSLS